MTNNYAKPSRFDNKKKWKGCWLRTLGRIARPAKNTHTTPMEGSTIALSTKTFTTIGYLGSATRWSDVDD
jgi:hypothetical protein